MSKNKDGSDRKVRKSTRESGFFKDNENEVNEIGRTFGSRLQAKRLEAGYTQQSFADKIGMSKDTYKGYDQGNYQPEKPFLIYFLAKEFGVSADYLVGLSDKEHPDYDEVIKQTGLSSDAISELKKLHTIDGGDVQTGYMDFINCFLGNKECTDIFMQGLLPMIRELSEACADGYPSERMQHIIATGMTDHIYDYINKVVIPSFYQQYNKGSFTPIKPSEYIPDEPKKRKK